MALICVHDNAGTSFYLPANQVWFEVRENEMMESSVPEGTWEEYVLTVYLGNVPVVRGAQESPDEMVALLDAAGIQCFVSAGKGEVERIKF